MICAAAVTAQFVGGKATRDALYLASLDVTSLPLMIVATAVFSIAMVAITSKVLGAVSPATFVPLAFASSAVLLLMGWGLTYAAPRLGAVVVYLQISGIGPLLGSGFWLIVTECFDPRTAKQRFGEIAGAGTFGGLLGGVFAERVGAMFGVAAMLPALAVLNLVCAWQIRRLAWALPAARSLPASALEFEAPPTRSGLRVLHEAPYLRSLAALVVFGTIGAALVDYVFKVHAVSTFGRGDGLLRFFAVYYAAISLITFAVQTSASRVALEKLGLAFTTGTPSLALFLTGIAGLIAPGLQSTVVARGGESIFRGSLFRSGYELFYTPIPAEEKRAAKSIIDVGMDRLGDAVGAGVIRLLLAVLPVAQQLPAMLLGSVVFSFLSLLVASRLSRGYIHTLERSLLNRAVELELSEVEDVTTRTAMFNTLTLMGSRFPQIGPPKGGPHALGASGHALGASVHTSGGSAPKGGAHASGADPDPDSDVAQIAVLRSRQPERIVQVLRKHNHLPAALVPHVIPLLAWDAVAQEAMIALRKVAEERIGELTDALVNPNQPFVIRRRLARVFSVATSQRAADGLLLGLDDLRFEVRYHCARSLTELIEKNPRIRIDKDRIFEVVQREAAVGRPVWDSQRLLHQVDDLRPNIFDDVVKDRASRSLAHVFTLLALVLPAEPLLIAFRGLQTDNQQLRGTALEYLEGVLPPTIRASLWPYLEDARTAPSKARPREQILDELLRSHQSILLNLEELKQRARASQTPTEASHYADEVGRS
jgi:ATP:ADP antiporter, AAA family